MKSKSPTTAYSVIRTADGQPRPGLVVVLIGLIALHAIGAAATLAHRSADPDVLGRYALDYFLLILVILGLLAGWIAVTIVLGYAAYRSRLNTIEDALARLLPIVGNTSGLSEAVEAKHEPYLQADVLTYLLPPPTNPLFAGWVRPLASHAFYPENAPPYLGLIPLALTIAAIAARDRRRETLPWIATGALFVILSMGPALRVGGVLYENIPLPAALLQRIPIFQIVRAHYYFLGLLLPLGVLSAIGLDGLLAVLNTQSGWPSTEIVSSILVIALAAEYWGGPMPPRTPVISPFYDQVAADTESYGLIDLPMDYDSSKRYLYYQTIHEHPIAGGMIGRIPPSAYATIEGNTLLARWRAEAPLDCTALPPEMARASAEQLADDGFHYVIVHRDRTAPWAATYFKPRDTVYHDNLVNVYAVDDLIEHPFCTE